MNRPAVAGAPGYAPERGGNCTGRQRGLRARTIRAGVCGRWALNRFGRGREVCMITGCSVIG